MQVFLKNKLNKCTKKGLYSEEGGGQLGHIFYSTPSVLNPEYAPDYTILCSIAVVMKTISVMYNLSIYLSSLLAGETFSRSSRNVKNP